MKVDVQFEAQLRQAAGTGSLVLQLAEPATISEVLMHSEIQTRSELTARLLNSEQQLHSSVLVFINEQPVQTDAASHRLQDGDSLLFLPPIAGG